MTVIKLISIISIVLASASYQSKVLADDPIKQVETKSTQLVDQKILKNVEKILAYNLSLLTETSQEFSYPEKIARNTFLNNDSIARKKAVNSSNIYYNKSMVKILNAEEKVNGRIATITVDAHEILYLANASYDSLAPSTSEEIAKYEFKFEKNDNSYKLISTKKIDPFKDSIAVSRVNPINLSPTVDYDGSLNKENNNNKEIEKEYSTRSSIAYLNKSAVVAYAYKYWSSYNPAFRSFKSDCTNFVSQALLSGGWMQIDGDRTANSSWWYNWLLQSYTWAGAQNFFNFTKTKNRGYLAGYFSNLSPGDLLQADWERDGSIDHTMIVTKKDYYGNIYLTYHSSNVKDRPIKDILAINPNAAYYGWMLHLGYVY